MQKLESASKHTSCKYTYNVHRDLETGLQALLPVIN
jgi:hypothetical protein